ncbi:hypothetical protein, partial [Streptomyces sp. NRRL S-87]|uniref:hypothetical protein n=1 Tax=Streptomyces sp. NRRL S-87 TaxID=1463920 RepID=UPI00131AD664
HHPLFQVMLAFQHDYEGRIELPGTTAAWTDVPTAPAKFALSGAVPGRPGTAGAPAGLTLECNYARDLYDADTVAALADGLGLVLDAVGADPDQRLGALGRA